MAIVQESRFRVGFQQAQVHCTCMFELGACLLTMPPKSVNIPYSAVLYGMVVSVSNARAHSGAYMQPYNPKIKPRPGSYQLKQKAT